MKNKLNIETFRDIHQLYISGTPIIPNKISDKMLYIRERDELYTRRLLAELEKRPPGTNWLAVVGVSHVAAPDSMSDHLRQKGYDLKPFNVYEEAMRLMDTPDASTK